MKNVKQLLAGIAGIFLSVAAFGQADSASATLSGVVNAGSLEIVSGVSGTVTNTGTVTVTGSLQSDAIEFNVDSITVNDLDGNGAGFYLRALPPSTIANSGATASLSLGTPGGFNNSSDSGNTTVSTNTTTNDTATYNSGTGVDGLTIDYDVSYDVPAFATADTYTGTLTIELYSN